MVSPGSLALGGPSQLGGRGKGGGFGKASVKDGPVHLDFPNLQNVRDHAENSPAGGELGLQERAALRLALSISFRRTIIFPCE